MKSRISVIWIMSLIVGCSSTGGGKANLDSNEGKASYAIGTQIGRGMKTQGIEVDPQTVAAGIEDALKGNEFKLTEQEMQQAVQQMQAAMMQKRQEEGQANKKKSDDFLAENKKKSSVKTTASGLQYEVLQEGKGDKPKATDRVTVHYRGTLIDGTEFDSSYGRNEPSSFPVSGVIKGWTEALQLMNPGSKWKLYIPSELAYGSMGRPNIPANSALIFDVELLKVEKDTGVANSSPHGTKPKPKMTSKTSKTSTKKKK